ncbi:hypothetical protein QL285_014363 [Trifolium repens]|nr:hypothetical protein QL285_014363 [Trifolium repens]
MVILRDLDDEDERNPPRPLIVGSPLERQVREHFTRPDGSIDYCGYFAEVMGEPFTHGELEGGSGGDSSDSSSDSSSGNNSDCVIISPSSFTGKRRDESLAIVAVGPEATTMEISSIYQDVESVEAYREKFDVSGTFDEKDFVFEPVKEGEYVIDVPRSDHVTFFMYTKFIEDFHLFFPFTEFQKSMLRVLNVAPPQLSPNSWSFIRAFELVCYGLEIPEPSVAVFFSFYHIKNFLPQGVTPNPRLINGAIYERLSEFERDTVAYLESMNQMNPRELLDADRAPAVLDKYLKDMSSLTPAQRLQYLEKARKKKEQPDPKVDVLSQLDVGEDKKKMKNDSRVNLQVRPSSSGPVGVEEVAKPEGEVKSPAKKKLRRLSRKGKKDQDVVETDKDLVDIDGYAAEGSPVVEEVATGASQSGGASPWDPMFDPEAFLSKMVDVVGNSARFNNTATDDLARMALGYELKGLLLNYALASRQRAELSIAKDKEALVEKNLATLERDVQAAKDRGTCRMLRDKESAIKTMNVVQASLNSKDEHIKTLEKENKTALAELETLKEEKAKWGSEKDGLEAMIGEQYDEGFQFALEQVKILFPGLDQDVLGKADAMSTIEGDKLVPYAPAEIAPDSPAKELPTEEPPAQSSPAKE